MKRIVLIVFLVGLIWAAGALYFRDRSPGTIQYVTSSVSVAPLRESITATGTVNAVVTVEVSSQLSGQIAELVADFNDEVKKGDAVAELDRQSYEARLAEARASLEMAKASVAIRLAELDRSLAELSDTKARTQVLEAQRDGALARYEAAASNLERAKNLRERGVSTERDLEEAETQEKIEAAALREAEAVLNAHELTVQKSTADVARQEADLQNSRANIPQKEALLKLAEVELERTVIRSPIDGIVIRRNVSEGQTVAASLEAPTLFTIAQDLKQMELHARVDETDIGRVKVGQKAQFSVDAFPGRVFEGSVTQIRKAPEVIQNVVTYTVVIETRNDDLLLLPGMTASLEILVMETEQVLRVPAAALAYEPSNPSEAPTEGPTVWKVSGWGEPVPVPVKTGLRDRSSIEITEGELAPGDEVVTNEIVTESDGSLFGLRIGF